MSARTVMLIGTSALMTGVAIVMLSVSGVSPLGFFVGTFGAGVGFGAGFVGGIRLPSTTTPGRTRISR
jgi:hypothetical protein